MALKIGITRPERGFLLSDDTDEEGGFGQSEPVAAFGESERAELHAAIDRMIDEYDNANPPGEAVEGVNNNERRPQNSYATDNARGGRV